MTIDLLKACPEHLPIVAAWYHDEWGYLRPTLTLADRIAELHAYLNETALPIAFVAQQDGEPVGVCNLRPRKPGEPDFDPWFAGLYVPPAHRRKGIALQLLAFAEAHAARIGLSRLYLSTPDHQHLYARQGWHEIAQINFRGLDETIMAKQLQP